MKQIKAVLLMSESHAAAARTFAQNAGIDLEAAVVDNLAALRHACTASTDLLLSFGTGVIVPQSILTLPKLMALNIHGASADFPGRDPHHFAHYSGAKKYGATLHFIRERVDSGPIVDMELFDVPDGATPAILLAAANRAGIELMRRLFATHASNGWPHIDQSLHWGLHKSTRRDFLELCRVRCDMDEGEFLRRLAATSMPGYSNLYIDLHGYRFRLEGKAK